MSCNFWKTPFYTQERMKVKKAINGLVCYYKNNVDLVDLQKWPWGPLRTTGPGKDPGD